MSAKPNKSTVEPIIDVVAAPVATAVAEAAPSAPSRANAITVGLDVASTVVISTLDALEELRVAVRGIATSGIEYGDSVARSVTATGRVVVERLDAAAGSVIAGARKVALDAIENARTAAPVAAAPISNSPVASA